MATTTTTQPIRPSSGPGGPPPGFGGPAPAGGLLNPSVDPIRLVKQYYKWLLVAGAFGVAIGIGAHFLLLFQFPLYTAKATLRALPYSEQITDAGGRTTGKEGGADEMLKFITTQQQIITSERLLSDAVNEPTIRNETKWAKRFVNTRTQGYDIADAAKKMSDDVIRTRSRSESVLIEVSATVRDRTDSATIANTVVRAYITRVQQRSAQESTDAMQILTRRLATVEADRLSLERRAQRMLGENRIETIEFQHTSAGVEINKLSPILVELKNAVKQRGDQLAQYEGNLTAQGGAIYPDFLRAEVNKDVTIFTHDQTLSSLRSQLGSARSRLGQNHMEVKRLEALVRSAEAQRAADEQRLLSEKFNALIELTRDEVRSIQTQIRESEENLRSATQRSAELTLVIEDYSRLKADIDRKSKERDELQVKISQLQDVIQSEKYKRVMIETPAAIPDLPSFPKPEIVIPVTAVLCVGLVGAFLLVRELLEQRVRTPTDVALIPRTRVLGVIPDLAEDPSGPTSLETSTKDQPDGVIAEQVRQLRTSIMKRLRPEGRSSLVLTSGLPGSGATGVLAALARSCAALNERILVIDANLRRPRCHGVFGVAEGPGLGEVLAGQATLESAAQKTDLSNLHVLSAGARASRVYERLNSDAMTALIESAKASYDLVIVDSPPMTVAGDAAVIASRCDASALVVRAFSETRGLIARVGRQIAESHGEFLGVIVNGVKSSAGGYFKKNYQLTHEYHGGGEIPAKTGRGEKKPAAAKPGAGEAA